MNLEGQLREAFAPCEPGPAAEAAVMAYVFDGVRRASRGKPYRRILVGTILVVAAAASMLVVQSARTPVHDVPTLNSAAVVVTTPAGIVEPVSPAAVVESVVAVGAPMAPVDAESPSAATKPAGAEQPITANPFTVHMQPLQNKAVEVDARAAIDLYYISLVNGLRDIPGLTLVELETLQPVEESGSTEFFRRANDPFMLAVSGNAGPQPGKVSLLATEGERKYPDGRSAGASFAWTRVIDIVPSCTSSPGTGAERMSCNDPASVAAALVDILRTRIFPPDPSLRQYLLTRVADARLDPNQRLKALTDLVGFNAQTGRAKLDDDVAIRGAIDLAAKSADPQLRARVWLAMRGARHADLLQPLLSAARDDPDGDTRLQAVETLAADFAEDQRARAALQTIAREDSRPMVRALAQRGLNDEAAWKDYVVASLKDTSRPVAERMEALMHWMHKPTPDGGTTPMNPREVFDDEVVQALGKALPLATEAPAMKRKLQQILVSLAVVSTPAVDSLLADLLEQNVDASLRITIVSQLQYRAGEPRVRSMLQKASGDSDPQLRQAATQALSAATPASN